MPLQYLLQIYTVGSLLKAWQNERNHSFIERLFDSPEQAHHAVATCAAWLGVRTQVTHEPVAAWWVGEGNYAPRVCNRQRLSATILRSPLYTWRLSDISPKGSARSLGERWAAEDWRVDQGRLVRQAKAGGVDINSGRARPWAGVFFDPF